MVVEPVFENAGPKGKLPGAVATRVMHSSRSDDTTAGPVRNPGLPYVSYRLDMSSDIGNGGADVTVDLAEFGGDGPALLFNDSSPKLTERQLLHRNKYLGFELGPH